MARNGDQGGDGSRPEVDDTELLAVVGVIRAEVRAFKRSGGLGDFSEDDLVHDVIVHLLGQDAAAWKKFDPARGKRATFVRKVARNRLLDRVRTEGRRRKTGMMAEPETDAVERAVDARDLEAVILGRLCADCIFDCLFETMSEKERETFVLSFVAHLSHREIAERLSSTVAAITSRLSSVKKRAEACNEQCGGLDGVALEDGK